jgi:hypothetical protein
MATATTAKAFDCIAFKRCAQERIAAETRGMSVDEEIAYFNRGALRGRLGPVWRRMRSAAKRR